jgi:hypothetical protein
MNDISFYEITSALSKYGKSYSKILPGFINSIPADQYQLSQLESSNKKVVFVHCSFLKYGDILDLSPADLVVVVDTELVPDDPKKFIQDLKILYTNNNVITITGGCEHSALADPTDIHIHPLLMLSSHLYNKIPESLSQILPTRNFDVLLGLQKDHRQFVLDRIIESQIENQCWINITTNKYINEQVRTIYRTPEINALEYIEVTQHLEQFGAIDSYKSISNAHNKLSALSFSIPWNIYNHSHWSIITESSDHIVYFTEKTGKAFFAQRPFVFFGAQHSLKRLKDWGFKTFDSVLDESYDTIADKVQRWKQAFEQVKALSKENPQHILQKVRPILDHNHNRLFELRQENFNIMQAMIEPHLK